MDRLLQPQVFGPVAEGRAISEQARQCSPQPILRAFTTNDTKTPRKPSLCLGGWRALGRPARRLVASHQARVA